MNNKQLPQLHCKTAVLEHTHTQLKMQQESTVSSCHHRYTVQTAISLLICQAAASGCLCMGQPACSPGCKMKAHWWIPLLGLFCIPSVVNHSLGECVCMWEKKEASFELKIQRTCCLQQWVWVTFSCLQLHPVFGFSALSLKEQW